MAQCGGTDWERAQRSPQDWRRAALGRAQQQACRAVGRGVAEREWCWWSEEARRYSEAFRRPADARAFLASSCGRDEVRRRDREITGRDPCRTKGADRHTSFPIRPPPLACLDSSHTLQNHRSLQTHKPIPFWPSVPGLTLLRATPVLVRCLTQALRLTRPPPVHTEIHGWTVAARGCNFSLLDASTQATASKQTLPLVSLPLALLPKSGIRKLTASYILSSLNTAVQEQAGHQPASSGMHLCTWPLD